jgi:hypothetical protein
MANLLVSFRYKLTCNHQHVQSSVFKQKSRQHLRQHVTHRRNIRKVICELLRFSFEVFVFKVSAKKNEILCSN